MIAQQQMWWPGYNVLDPLAEEMVVLYPIWEGPGTSKIHNLVKGDGIPDGTLTDMDPATDWVTSPYGYALDLDGDNDHISIPAPSNVVLNPNAITIYARIKTAAITETHKILFAPGTSLHGLLRVYDDRLIADTPGLTDNSIAALGVITTNWQDVAFTYDGATKRLFIDGVQVIQEAATGSITWGTEAAWKIGIRTGSASEFFIGQIALLAVWNRALPAATIKKLYAKPNALTTLRSQPLGGVAGAPPAPAPSNFKTILYHYYRRRRAA